METEKPNLKNLRNNITGQLQLDIEYNKYVDYQKIDGKPVSKIEFKKVVDKHNFNVDEVMAKKKSAEKHKANLQKQAAKKVAKANKKNQMVLDAIVLAIQI